MDILEQIGITKEELIERIVEKALGITADYKQTGEETWEDIPFSSVVDKNIKAALEKFVGSMEGKISDRIETLLNEKMLEVFEREYQPVDRWGKPSGAVTTVRDRIADMAEAYWTTPVNSRGEAEGYERKPRFEWAVQKCVAQTMNNELTQAATKIAQEMKARIPKEIGDEISKTIFGYLR